MKVMMTFRSDSPRTLQEIQQQFGLADAEVDHEFGVVEIDPEDHLFAFMVDENKAAQVSSDPNWSIKGPFSNPKIEPFGPPR